MRTSHRAPSTRICIRNQRSSSSTRVVLRAIEYTLPVGYTASTGKITDTIDDGWYYKTSAAGTFSRNDGYGQTNPDEDMATTWEAYFVSAYHGPAAMTTLGLVQVSAKWNTLDSLFSDLR